MATGDTLLIVPAAALSYPSSAYATPDVRNNHVVADFDAATDESVLIESVLPGHYAGGGLTVTLIWLASSAMSGNCIWNVEIERHQDDVDDLDADSFAAANSTTAAPASASGEAQYSDVTFTDGADMDSLAAGESFRMRITRDADNVSDTMTGDAELLRVHIKET